MVVPPSGHLSNFCSSVDPPIEPADVYCFQIDSSAPLTLVQGGYPQWIRTPQAGFRNTELNIGIFSQTNDRLSRQQQPHPNEALVEPRTDRRANLSTARGLFCEIGGCPHFFRLWGIGVVADLFGLPEVAAVVSGHVRQKGTQGYFDPLEQKRSLDSGQVEAVGFLNELG